MTPWGAGHVHLYKTTFREYPLFGRSLTAYRMQCRRHNSPIFGPLPCEYVQITNYFVNASHSGVQEGRYKAIWKREFKTPMAQGRSTEIITMIKWIRTSRLSIKELSLSFNLIKDLYLNALTRICPSLCHTCRVRSGSHRRKGLPMSTFQRSQWSIPGTTFQSQLLFGLHPFLPCLSVSVCMSLSLTHTLCRW